MLVVDAILSYILGAFLHFLTRSFSLLFSTAVVMVPRPRFNLRQNVTNGYYFRCNFKPLSALLPPPFLLPLELAEKNLLLLMLPHCSCPLPCHNLHNSAYTRIEDISSQ
jgi:hypothetical protein